jgi:hypothetical protein
MEAVVVLVITVVQAVVVVVVVAVEIKHPVHGGIGGISTSARNSGSTFTLEVEMVVLPVVEVPTGMSCLGWSGGDTRVL